MLKKSKATPYTSIDNMNHMTPGNSGLPIPKNPNLKTHANIAINITFLMPNFFIKKGMSRIHNVSDI